MKAFFDAVRSRPQDRELDERQLSAYVGETARRGAPRLWRFVLVAAIPFGLIAWSAIASPAGPAREIQAELIAEEIPLAAVTNAAYHGSDGAVWLRQTDSAVVRVDLTSGHTFAVRMEISGLTVTDGKVLALVPGTPSQVVELTDDEPREVVRLPDGVTGLLAVDEHPVYVGGGDGRLARFDRATGAPAAEVDTGAPVAKLMAGGGAVWTLHPVAEPTLSDGRYRCARRDPATLAPAGEQPPEVLLDDLVMHADGQGWIALGPVVAPYPISPGATAGTTNRPRTGTGGLPAGCRLRPGRDSSTVWARLPLRRRARRDRDRRGHLAARLPTRPAPRRGQRPARSLLVRWDH